MNVLAACNDFAATFGYIDATFGFNDATFGYKEERLVTPMQRLVTPMQSSEAPPFVSERRRCDGPKRRRRSVLNSSSITVTIDLFLSKSIVDWFCDYLFYKVAR